MQGLWISMAAWDVSSDVWIIVLPVPFIWKLNLRAGEKVMLSGMFCLGAMYVYFSLCRAALALLMRCAAW